MAVRSFWLSSATFPRSGDEFAVRPMRTPKTAELLTRRLRRMIVDGELRDGDHLPREAELMEHFGVSRPTLREAVRVLEAESLVEVRRGARTGARVRVPGPEAVARPAGLLLQINGATLAEVLAARLGVEPLAAWLVADRGSPQACAALEKALEQVRAAAQEPGGLGQAAAVFHATLAEQSGNRVLVMMVGMLREIITRHLATAARRQYELDPDEEQVQARRTLRAYAKLIQLVREGEADEAERFWRSHLEAANALLLRGFEGAAVIDVLE